MTSEEKIIAKWGDKQWLVSDKKIMGISGLSTTYIVKETINYSLNKKNANNFTGTELISLSFSTKLVEYNEVKVREQIKQWESLLGDSHPLEIGGIPFGAPAYKLKEVNVGDIQLDDSGNFISASLSFRFDEDTDYEPETQADPNITEAEKEGFQPDKKVRIFPSATKFFNNKTIPRKYIGDTYKIVTIKKKPSRVKLNIPGETEECWVLMEHLTLV